MNSTQQLLADVREKRVKSEAFDHAIVAAGSRPFGSRSQRVAYGVFVGLVVLAGVTDSVMLHALMRGPLIVALLATASFVFGLLAHQRKKMQALLWLIENTNPDLHAKIVQKPSA